MSRQLFKATNRRETAQWLRQFAAMTSAGLSLTRALDVLGQEGANGALRSLSQRLKSRVEEGSSLGDAMTSERLLPGVVVSLVRVGEAGGTLDTVLASTAQQMELNAFVGSKLRAALTYPLFVLLVTSALIAAVLIAIVPVFTRLFSSLHAPLPLPTRIVVSVAHLLHSSLGLFIVVAIVMAALLGVSLVRAPRAQRYIQTFLWRTPVVGRLVQEAAMARVAATLSALVITGVSVVEALSLVAEAAQSYPVAVAMKGVKEGIRHGQALSVLLRQSGVFSPLLCALVAVGEESGNVGELLQHGANAFRSALERRVGTVTAIVEPLVVVVTGIFIGAVIISLYLPMLTYVRYVPS
jgi:type IV pilus assembly protein PilC